MAHLTLLLDGISDRWRADPRTGASTRLLDGIRVTIVPTSLAPAHEPDTSHASPVVVTITDTETNETHHAGEYPHLLAAMAAIDRSI